MDRAVLFDLDDTLLVDVADVDACFRRVTAGLETAGGLEPGTLAASVRAAARERWRASPQHSLAMRLGFSSWEGLTADFVGGHESVEVFRRWAPAYRVDAWVAGLDGVLPADEAAAYAERYRRERRSHYRLLPGALDLVTAVRADGWRVGIVTNGPPDLQREKVEATGLADLVDAVVISGEVGEGKPDAAIFEHALGRLGVDAGDAVMVGDSIERDMRGAAAAGLRTVWRRTDHARDGSWPVFIESLSDLPALLP